MELGYRDELLLSVLIEYFFLGYYWYLVLTCTLALLLSRMRLPGLLQLVLVTMFLISVAALSVDTIVVYREIDSPSGSYPFQLRRPRVILRVGNSAISQAIVSTRCLKLWPRNKFAMAATAVLFSASIATGIFGVSGDPSSIRGQMLVYNWTNMASTGILSGVIIARTLWMRKQVTKVYDPVHLDCYPKINMLIDSGIGFPVLALIDRLIPFNPLQAALVQIAGITAGRIILQTALGRNPRCVESLMKELSEQQRSSTPVLDTIFGSTMGPSLPAGIDRTASMQSQIPPPRDDLSIRIEVKGSSASHLQPSPVR
ncbi:hypothetical protein CC2G_003255 [Coprinopsis cinerea AmutBmut pab1-1]|nr:hypothetical protein CC2G_003255 [Coprinopsis cinerea AmutBmut pab1-1]